MLGFRCCSTMYLHTFHRSCPVLRCSLFVTSVRRQPGKCEGSQARLCHMPCAVCGLQVQLTLRWNNGTFKNVKRRSSGAVRSQHKQELRPVQLFSQAHLPNHAVQSGQIICDSATMSHAHVCITITTSGRVVQLPVHTQFCRPIGTLRAAE